MFVFCYVIDLLQDMRREEKAADAAQAKLYEQETNMQAQVGYSLPLAHPLGWLSGEFRNVS